MNENKSTKNADPRSPRPAKSGELSTGPGRFAYDGLERVIHERARLSIMTSLAAHPRGVLFNDLRELCALTDGNLNRHLAVLEEAGLVEVWKGHHNRRPQTLYRITATGRARMLEYVAELERVLADALSAERKWPRDEPGGMDATLRPA